ncbi:hypothetical protein Fcan01_16272 [Folsomia candida]|uniref:Uncharacterized protein n=1 Tax=Folsomia candida TaxID=158441 RepID=A0A226DXP9_FOLCA|nr:hypothetical protein Fcan01_16272 [Folsomia candida]
MAILVRIFHLLSIVTLLAYFLPGIVDATIICVCAAAKCDNASDTWTCQNKGFLGQDLIKSGGTCQFPRKMEFFFRLVRVLLLLTLFACFFLGKVDTTIICACIAPKCNNYTDTYTCQTVGPLGLPIFKSGGTCQFVNQQCGFRCQGGFGDICASI